MSASLRRASATRGGDLRIAAVLRLRNERQRQAQSGEGNGRSSTDCADTVRKSLAQTLR
jgi:hypothetical protein